MTFKTLALLCSLPFTYLPAAHADTDTSRALSCFETIKPASSFAFQNPTTLEPAKTIELNEGFVVVTGSLGWHVTWAVLFDFNTTPTQAYETYGFDASIDGAFGRRPVPAPITAALKRCGFEWQGLWALALPDQQNAKQQHVPKTAPDVTTLPAPDLLPPQD